MKERKRIPFHYGLFYHAMIGLMGRDPDHAVRYGFDGYYEFWYKPQTEKDYQLFHKRAEWLAEWLDNFEIIKAQSQCEFVSIAVSGPPQMILVVRINLEQKRKLKCNSRRFQRRYRHGCSRWS